MDYEGKTAEEEFEEKVSIELDSIKHFEVYDIVCSTMEMAMGTLSQAFKNLTPEMTSEVCFRLSKFFKSLGEFHLKRGIEKDFKQEGKDEKVDRILLNHGNPVTNECVQHTSSYSGKTIH